MQRRVRIRIVIEEDAHDSMRATPAQELVQLELAQLDHDRILIVERLTPIADFAKTVMRLLETRVVAEVRGQLTAALGEVGGALGHRLKNWHEPARPAEPEQ